MIHPGRVNRSNRQGHCLKSMARSIWQSRVGRSHVALCGSRSDDSIRATISPPPNWTAILHNAMIVSTRESKNVIGYWRLCRWSPFIHSTVYWGRITRCDSPPSNRTGPRLCSLAGLCCNGFLLSLLPLAVVDHRPAITASQHWDLHALDAVLAVARLVDPGRAFGAARWVC